MEASAFAPRGLLVRRYSDRESLAAALEGDSVAFAEVYRRFNTRIHGFCLSKLGDAEAAADVTQEVFIRVLRSDAANIENPSAWLYAIARNAIIDAQRSAGRRPVPSEIGEAALTVNGRAPASAHELVVADQDVVSVMLAMRSIAPRYRTAIVMRDIKGLTSAEAAKELKTSPGTLDTLLHRARRALASEHGRLATLPPACVRANEILHAVDPGQVSATDAQALEVHLLGCEVCRKEKARMRRRGALQALLPFLFPLDRATDAISRLALVGAHPIFRVAATGLLVAAVAAVPVQMTLRPPATVPPRPAPAAVSTWRAAAASAHGTVARLTAASGMLLRASRALGTGLDRSPMMGRVAAGPAGLGHVARIGIAARSAMGRPNGTSVASSSQSMSRSSESARMSGNASPSLFPMHR
jgi:RNA polymerase sigma-70 factor (ECF subfamily)